MNTHDRPLWKGLCLYALAALAVGVLCLVFREPTRQEPLGQLEGRFDSAITYERDGTIFHYREMTLTNLLIMGIDRQEGDQLAGQTDFLLLLTADRESRTLSLTHIDRDTITEIGTYGIFGDRAGTLTTQICLAHAYGATEDQRCGNTVQAVSDLFGGIVIDGYIAMDIGGIARLNEALGGVTVTLEDDFSRIDATMVPGKTLTLTGKQAEIFVRYRSDVANGTNENRMARQRTYLAAVLAILEAADAEFLENVLTAMGPEIYTNLAQNTLADYADRWKTYEKQEIQPLLGRHALGEDGFVAFYPEAGWLEGYLLEHFFQERAGKGE